jgi:uncharacterized membrane protein YvbJ
MPYCRNCGTQLREDVQYCYNCGTSVTVQTLPKITTSTIQQQNTQEKSSSAPAQNGLFILMLLTLIITVISIVIVVVLLSPINIGINGQNHFGPGITRVSEHIQDITKNIFTH